VFFFQAEDGIRDFHVTGVQTCALPISSLTPVYPTTAGLSQAQLRAMIERALDNLALEDTLEPATLGKLGLQGFRESVMLLHRPRSEERRVGKESGSRRGP